MAQQQQQQRRRATAAIGRRQNLLLLVLLALSLALLAGGARASPRDRERERERQSERRSSRGSSSSSSSTSGSRQDRAADAKAKDVKASDADAKEPPAKEPPAKDKTPPPKAAAPPHAPPPKKAPPPPPPPPPELPSYARNTSAYAWTGAGSPSFNSYPEVTPGQPWSMPLLLERPALAVALGSGGARAAPLALGWARALARMGVMSHARHLAATSASAWVAAPYAYQSSGGDDSFFGPWLPPEHLGPTAADLPRTLSPGSFGASVAGKGVMPIGGALGALLPGGSSASDPSGAITRWTSGVATVFLEPFGLASVAPPTAVGTLSSNASSRAAAALKGAQGGIGSAADGPFLFDAIRATRDGGLLGLFGAALGGGSGGSGASSSSSSSGKPLSAAPTFDPARGGGRPFPIVAASVVTPVAGASSSSSTSSNDKDNNNRLLWRPFEMTPLYSGLPVAGVPASADPKLLSGVLVENLGGNSRVRPSFANATKEAAQRSWEAEMAQKQGGSVVSAAANANANATASDLLPKRPADLPFLSSSPSGGPVELLLQAPAARDAPPLSLAAVLGGASSDPSLATSGNGKDRDSLQEAYLASPGSLTGQWLDLADGAATDSTAVTAALRRKPTHLVACLSTKEGPEKTAAEWASAEPGVAALFGATGGAASPSSSSSSATHLHPSQVFARADYEKFFAALRRAWLRPLDNPSDVPGFKEGVASPLRPGTLQAARTVAPVFRTRHSVLSNPKAGVPGGHDVEVLWVVNARSGAWESRLPIEVRTLVQGARGVLGSPTADFPYLPHAVSSALSTEAFVLLSQQADWQLREASDRVVEFVADAQAEHARARYLSEARAAGLGGSGGGGKA
jgi:hypothetical protein